MNVEYLVNTYGTYIYNYAMKLTCHPQKAEDIAQETFIRAWKNLEQLKDEGAVKKWLRTICMNCFLIDYRKENAHQTEPVEDIEKLEKEGILFCREAAEPDEEVLVEENIRELQNGCFFAMARRLTLKQRIAFSMTDMYGMPIAEVAELLELSENATKGLLHRARMNLDAFFSDHCNLIDAKNPCSCQAWITFSKHHEANQQKMQDVIGALEEKAKGYHFDARVRAKVKFLYHQIPDRKPEEGWYRNTILALRSE